LRLSLAFGIGCLERFIYLSRMNIRPGVLGPKHKQNTVPIGKIPWVLFMPGTKCLGRANRPKRGRLVLGSKTVRFFTHDEDKDPKLHMVQSHCVSKPAPRLGRLDVCF
jgi:hypothetical protein